MLDLSLMDGVEVNCHPLYDETHLNRLSNIASNNNLLLTCGGDYRADTHRVKCGVFLLYDLSTTLDVVNYLKHTNQITMCVQKVGMMNTYSYKFNKTL